MPVETARRAISSHWFDRLARFGYAAKGTVFGTVGILAAKLALGRDGDDENADFSGALAILQDEPLTLILLVLLSLGLFAYTFWRFVQALADVEGEGTDLKGWLKRGMYLGIGLTYGWFAIYSAGLLLGMRQDEDDGFEEETAVVLSQPYGEWIVGIVGLVIIVSGLNELYFAFSRRFKEEFHLAQMSRLERMGAVGLGGYGHAARGIVYCLAGFFAVRAAVNFDPDEARGLADTFREIATQPSGPWLLGFVAVGFIAFGLYCVMLAFHRHIPNEELGE
ncbi:DUF1206 domain-containing protein [soil metagenome]